MYKTQIQQLKHLDKTQYNLLRKLCYHSARLYNYGLYSTRQQWFQTQTFLRYNDNYHICKDNENYKALPALMAQQTLKMVDRGMRSFLALLKLAKKGGYKNPINLPSYLDKQGHFTIIIPNMQRGGFIVKDGKLHLAISMLMKEETGLKNLVFNFPKNVDPKAVKEIRIHPKHNAHYFTMEVVYEIKEQEKTNATGILGIDVGLNNLATCWDSKNNRSFIVDGRKVKSINHYWNKQNSKLQSIKDKQGYKHYTRRQFLKTQKRNRRIRDYMHKAARKIIDYCLANEIGKIIVGHNVGWKDEINLGRKTNQNFVQVPFGKLMEHLRYKAQENGLEYQEICESHTSKCSFLDLEDIKHHDEYVGKRVKRGLFRSSSGLRINADVNGAANIMRKVTAISTLVDEQIKGIVAYPLRIHIT